MNALAPRTLIAGLLATIVTLAHLGGAWAAPAKPGMLEFVKARRGRRYSAVPRKVLAFYYTWYGNPTHSGKWVHWRGVKPDQHDIASSTNYPERGAYDSNDPALIDYHIELAQAAGIDGFIATWWGPNRFSDKALPKLLDRAEAKGFSVTIYWESVPGKGQDKRDRAVKDLTHVLRHYGRHPAFLKVDGKPVVFVYGRVMGQIELTEWPEIITRSEIELGQSFLLMADGMRPGYPRVLDGLHVYNIAGWWRSGAVADLAGRCKQVFPANVRLARSAGKISCLTIIPGYDDTKIRKPGLNAPRQDGATYATLWREAIAADPDWVLITSFNEWHEGSEIEPSYEHSRKYIEMTGPLARQFKARPPVRQSAPEPAMSLAPAKAQALRRAYADKTIGVLPGYRGRVAFWLSDVGLGLKELSWESVLDPATFNAKALPVVLYAGHEQYVQTVRQAGDVDESLRRYLHEGGLLMALPVGPIPFYRNEKGKGVNSAPKLGVPVGHHGDKRISNWERPPKGAGLKFVVAPSRLPGLPASVPYPASGDVRWRPSSRHSFSDQDQYVPLVRLQDAGGKWYGDAVVYAHRKTSEPKNGRYIYAWMRIPDIFDRDEMLYRLFMLAAEGPKPAGE